MVDRSEDAPDGRQRYRSSPDSSEQLAVTAVDGLGRKVPAQVVDLSAGGIGLFFPKQADPNLEIGETIYLHLASSHLRKPLVALAQVCRGSTFDWGHNYGFRFVDWIGLLSQIPQSLAPLFNQRSEWRVKLEPKHTTAVAVEIPPTASKKYDPMRGVLRDISPMGLSFRVKPEAEEAISSSPLVHVSFALPGSTEVLSFWARILHRETSGQELCYGAMFDREATARFDEKQDSLVRMLRQPTAERDAEPS